jgi:transposase-like protein
MNKNRLITIARLSNDCKNDSHSDTQPENCPRCGSANLSKGAGLKPGQISLKCNECKTFIGYRNLQELKKLKRRKRLTPCLELLEKQGLSSDAAIFVLGQVGGEK